MRAKLIVNPVSGRDTAPDFLASINRTLRRRTGVLDIEMTIGEGDAADIAARAVRDGFDHLFVCGGDGTLNEVVNGVAQVDEGFERAVLAVVPLGTGNDFATAMGMPDSVEQSAEALLEASISAIDLGVLNGRYFVNVSAGGFIAEVSDAVNPQLKTLAGRFAYLLGGAQVVFNFEPIEARFAAPARPTRRLHTFAVCNSRLIGGGHMIAPTARPDDGLFDVCVIPEMPTVEFVALLRRLSEGRHVDDERVEYFQTASIDIAFNRPIKVNTDGQVLEATTCEYRLLPKAARFLVPITS